MSELDQLLVNIQQANSRSQAQKNWHPKHIGSIDIRIAADGSWFHEGRPFQRKSLVKLFASVLRREGDDYYLCTPAEKLKIQVDDAPFVANLVDRIEENKQTAIVFTTNMGEPILVDAEHSIRIETDEQTKTPRPYIHYRDGLDALISRNAFFELINMADQREQDGKLLLTISSLGHEIILGCVDSQEN